MEQTALLLGGATIYCKTGDDVNNYDNGNYSCHLSSIKNTMSNLPEGLTDSDFEIISRKVEMYKYQQLIGQTNNTLYQRTYKGNAWTKWIRVDNYGTSSLSDLASLLGALTYKGNAGGVNFDNIQGDRGYWIKTNDNVQGLPSDAAGHGVIIMFNNIQVLIAYDNGTKMSISMRAYNLYVVGWGTWITMKNW